MSAMGKRPVLFVWTLARFNRHTDNTYDDVMYAPGTGIEFLRAKAHFDQSQGCSGTK